MLNLYIEGTTLRDFFLQIIIWHTLQTDKQTPKQYLNINSPLLMSQGSSSRYQSSDSVLFLSEVCQLFL